MADIKAKYDTADQSVTITLSGLASGSSRECTIVDNSSNYYLDAICHVRCIVSTGTPAGDKCAYVYVYGVTGGTTYPEGITAADAAYTIGAPSNLILAGVVNITAQSTTRDLVFSVANCFGGTMPSKWGVVVYNYCGIALAASSFVKYQGVYAQTV